MIKIDLLAEKVREWAELPSDPCRDVMLPSDLNNYIPGKLCEWCWTETVGGKCPNECEDPPMCDKCGRRHEDAVIFHEGAD